MEKFIAIESRDDTSGSYTASWLVIALSIVGIAAVLRQENLLISGYLIILVWIATFSALTAGMPVKFPRYLSPIYPGMFIFVSELFRLLIRSDIII